MNAYGTLLKKLIRFTNIKLTNLAEIVGYDTSYISKWCNKGKLPAAKAAPNVNKCLADVFAREIIIQEEATLFDAEFNASGPYDESSLSSTIFQLLKDAYKRSYDNTSENAQLAGLSSQRMLLWQLDIKNFFVTELPQLLHQLNEPCQILCTMDICGFLTDLSYETGRQAYYTNPVHIKMGINLGGHCKNNSYIPQLYYFLNHYNDISFDFYENTCMDYMNLFIVKNCIAVQCALDKDYRISIAHIITDTAQVNSLYQKVNSEFTLSRLMIHSSDSEELFYNGYRTEFYAHNTFQIMVAKGFEFLLPPEINPRLIQAARDQGFDESMAQLVAHLGITWEEIFEKGAIDFYLLKTNLIRYITDGTIYFADVVYHMSVEERKKHIQHVLDLVQKNPNIRFFIIDDECIPNSEHLFQMSVYNNKRKLFLKNMEHYDARTHLGPSFYTMQNETLIGGISQYFSELQSSSLCNVYGSEDVFRFYEKYGIMIDRMLSIEE